MPPLVVLVGPPGSGKSTVGRAVARRLGVHFRDTDTDVEMVTGKRIGDIFVEDGEERFRVLEREAVRRAIDEHDGVLALGGGAVLDGETRTLLATQRVVYLSVDHATAFDRVGMSKARPLIAVNPRAELRRLLDERRPLYEEVATTVVDTGGRAEGDVVDDVVQAVSR